VTVVMGETVDAEQLMRYSIQSSSARQLMHEPVVCAERHTYKLTKVHQHVTRVRKPQYFHGNIWSLFVCDTYHPPPHPKDSYTHTHTQKLATLFICIFFEC